MIAVPSMAWLAEIATSRSRIITQAALADALGLSTVHLNRTLQQLRSSGIISITREKVIIKNWDKVQDAGEFDPTYLHLKG
jgi:CRP-like cAMP-binding protein